jgi:uncharacterized protein involved in exopolysaccharide biosynthesis
MRRTPVAALVGAGVFLLTVIGSVFYARSLPDVYTGETVVQFSPRAADNGNIPSGDVVSSAAAGYVAYLGAPSTVAAVAPTIGTTTTSLRDDVTVTLIPATTTVTIDFDSEDPQLAAKGADAMAAAVVARSKDDPLITATVLAPASIPDEPSGPQRVLILAAGILLGILLGVVSYLLVNLLVTRRGGTSDDAPAV